MPRVAVALGDGPVYPVVGMSEPPPSPRGVVELEEESFVEGFYRLKTLWAIDPAVRGETRITAYRFHDRARVRFLDETNEGFRQTSELALPAPGGDWSYAPTTTLLRGAGCFAFRVAVERASDVIVFEAALKNQI